MKLAGFMMAATIAFGEKRRDPFTEQNLNDAYPNDPRDVIGMAGYEPDQLTVKLNAFWLESVMNTPKISNFIHKMINMEDVVVVTPASAISHIDDTPYCWVMLAYNSITDEAIHAELSELARGLAKYYYQRCGVGLLDLAYPSNGATFPTAALKQSPSIILRKALKNREMFDVDKIIYSGLTVPMNDVEKWGEIIPTAELVRNISAVLNRIDKMFDRLHPNHKIGSMFMEQYEFDPDSEEEKLRLILNNVLGQLHDIANSITSQQQSSPDNTDDSTSLFMTEKMEQLFLSKDLEEILNETYRSTYNQSPSINFTASTPTNSLQNLQLRKLEL